MYNINATKKLGELELEAGLEGNRSWHHQYGHSAYVYIGGLDQRMTEGDVVIVFSQFGEIVDVNLIRDKTSGKSKGFAFVCYEDQRSTILAVDNMNGYQLLNKTLRVDHVDKYKAPKNLNEDVLDENGDPTLMEYNATGAEGAGQHVYNVIGSQKKIAEIHSQKREIKINKPEDEDEAWAKAFDKSVKQEGQEEIKRERKKLKKEMKELKKNAKKETKKAKKEAKKLKEATKAVKKEAKDSKKAAKKVKKESSNSCSDSSDSS